MKPYKVYSVAHLQVNALPQQEVRVGRLQSGQWGLFTNRTIVTHLDGPDPVAALAKANRMGMKFITEGTQGK